MRGRHRYEYSVCIDLPDPDNGDTAALADDLQKGVTEAVGIMTHTLLLKSGFKLVADAQVTLTGVTEAPAAGRGRAG